MEQLVEKLRISSVNLQNDVGELAEGLLVIGKIHSPGVVVLRDSEVELIPIVGERCTIALGEIRISR